MPSDRFSFPDQVWFDASNPETLHDALRMDYARTKEAVDRRPSLRRHLAECLMCQEITAATSGAPAPMAGRKRIKLVIDTGQMHQLLGLPANFEIVHMFADPDPNIVCVLVAGEGLPETDPLAGSPIVSLDAVPGHTVPRPS